jgi:hypothetical protein
MVSVRDVVLSATTTILVAQLKGDEVLGGADNRDRRIDFVHVGHAGSLTV